MRKKQNKRAPTQLTSVHVKEVLAGYLDKITKGQESNPLEIVQAWPEIIGEKLSGMTRAVSFVEGVLNVRVNNSALYSLLMQHEKPKLLQALRDRFPKIEIKTITFRIG